MMSILRMLWFHLRQFTRVGYFVVLLVSGTTSMFLLQLLALRAAAIGQPGATHLGLTLDPQLWLRSALVGMWSVCTVSAGIIGFHRMQGTLVHVLFSPRSPLATLGPIVAAGSGFGVVAFPLSAGLAMLVGQPIGLANGMAGLLLGVVLYWVACLSISVVVAAIFVFSRNAIAYEPLLMIPLVILSGVFGYPLPSLRRWGG